MKKTHIIIVTLCLSVFILTSVVHADVISPGTPGTPSEDPGASSKDELNSIWIINAVLIVIIALIAGLVIRRIKKDNGSK